MLQGYENLGFEVDNDRGLNVRHRASGWELRTISSGAGQDQGLDLLLRNLRIGFGPVVASVEPGRLPAEARGPETARMPASELRRKFGKVFRVHGVNNAPGAPRPPWPEDWITALSRLVFIRLDVVGWFENEQIKPDILHILPATWPRDCHRHVVHSPDGVLTILPAGHISA